MKDNMSFGRLCLGILFADWFWLCREYIRHLAFFDILSWMVDAFHHHSGAQQHV